MSPFLADNLWALSVQTGVLALAGAPLPRLLGIRSPRARLAYWRALLLACLLLPFVQPLVPQVVPATPVAANGVTEQVGERSVAFAVDASPETFSAWPRITVLELVAAGIAARSAWFLFGLVTLGRLRRRASRLDPKPGSVVDAIGLAHADAEFRLAATQTRPVTFGLLRPVVIVPSDFRGFGEGEQKAIACHELVHVRRKDWIRNIGDELVRAFAWFHPAAWWLTRQVRLAREQVVDQEVVRQLGARKPYLDALLLLASPDRGSVFVPAPLFLGRSHLSDRVALLLKEVRMSRPRLVVSFLVMALVLTVTGRAVVAAWPMHAAPDSTATLQAPGTQKPGQMTALPGKPALKLRLLNHVRPAFPTGSPDIPVIVEASVDANGNVTQVTPVEGPANLASIAAEAARQWRFSAPGKPMAFLVGFNPSAGTALADQPPVFVGPNVRAPEKIKDVKPAYPADAQQARVQGVVILQTTIASDGTVTEAQILRSIPMLDRAAMTAVLQWKFTPRGLPLQMTVTVNFQLQAGPAKGVAGGVPGGVAGGVAGGVERGVAGGVAGSQLGGLPGAPPPPSPTGAPLRVGDNIKAPLKIHDVKPTYPKDAQEARVQGVVIIETTIGPDGKVKDAKILRSIQMLDQAALEAVWQWEFQPTLLNGQAVPVIMTVTVNFVLE